MPLAAGCGTKVFKNRMYVQKPMHLCSKSRTHPSTNLKPYMSGQILLVEGEIWLSFPLLRFVLLGHATVVSGTACWCHQSAGKYKIFLHWSTWAFASVCTSLWRALILVRSIHHWWQKTIEDFLLAVCQNLLRIRTSGQTIGQKVQQYFDSKSCNLGRPDIPLLSYVCCEAVSAACRGFHIIILVETQIGVLGHLVCPFVHPGISGLRSQERNCQRQW